MSFISFRPKNFAIVRSEKNSADFLPSTVIDEMHMKYTIIYPKFSALKTNIINETSKDKKITLCAKPIKNGAANALKLTLPGVVPLNFVG